MESTDVRNEMSGLQELLEARTSELEKTKMELRDARSQTETYDKLVTTLEKDLADLRTDLDREEAAKKAMAEVANVRLVSLNEQEEKNEKLRAIVQNMEVEREHMTEDIVGLQRARDTMLEQTPKVVGQMDQGQDDTTEDSSTFPYVQQGTRHVRRENERLRGQLASLTKDHAKLAGEDASFRSEHEKCCILMAARQVDLDTLDQESTCLEDKLETTSRKLQEVEKEAERSREAARSFLLDQSHGMNDLVYERFGRGRVAAELQHAVDRVDLHKTVPWTEVSALERAFCGMEKHDALLSEATKRLYDKLLKEVNRYAPHPYEQWEVEHDKDTEPVELSFEEQKLKLKRLYACHIEEMKRKHRVFVTNIRTNLEAELNSNTH